VTAYYNEKDRYCAQWLRNLVAASLIAPGDVDERDVRDVVPADLRGYRQVHLFAGIGLWSHALRLADWGDDRPVWTCSCPCQPFSGAGRGDGIFDDRHLWPAAHWLIAQLAPRTVFGEQVAGADGTAWLDIVSSDLEALGYRCGAVAFSSAGVGAPNIRQRLFWLANASVERCAERGSDHAATGDDVLGRHGATGGVADANRIGQRWTSATGRQTGTDAGSGCDSTDGGLADTSASVRAGSERDQPRRLGGSPDGGRMGDADPGGRARFTWEEEALGTVATGAPPSWREPEWVGCTDGRWRPFERGSFPLAARYPGDVAKLRAYGNAINPVAAAAFVRAFLDLKP
jgi:DNA (cytosine-5)-methyltransferase 1